MTGLENIIAQIENDSKVKAEEIISGAKSTAEKITDNAVLEAEEISNKYKEIAKKRADELVLRGKSADEAAMNKAKLAKKQEIIKDTINNVKAEIKEWLPTEYFGFLEKLLKKNTLDKDGIVLISGDDKNELSAEFKKLAEQNNLKIQESNNMQKHSGFILVYGNIEINCTIDAVFDEAAERITDMLSELLFGVEGGV